MNTTDWKTIASAVALMLVAASTAGAHRRADAPPLPLTECEAVAHYRFENGTPGEPARGNATIVDSIGRAHGTPVGDPVYRGDVGAARALSCKCKNNAISLQLTAGQSVRVDAPFIFHRAYGDATLEFLVKPREQPHNSLFWTRADNDDRDRYNIAINSNGGFGFDYRAPSGLLHLTPAHISLFSLPADRWSHVAVVRDTQTSAPAHVYRFYVNGEPAATRTDPVPNLPTSTVWQVSGRTGYYYSGWIDEIRFTPRQLTPGEFTVGGPCSACRGREKLSASCKDAKLSAKLTRAEPESTATFRLDDDPDTDVQAPVNRSGKSKVKFKNVPSGRHKVEMLECAVEAEARCP